MLVESFYSFALSHLDCPLQRCPCCRSGRGGRGRDPDDRLPLLLLFLDVSDVRLLEEALRDDDDLLRPRLGHHRLDGRADLWARGWHQDVNHLVTSSALSLSQRLT